MPPKQKDRPLSPPTLFKRPKKSPQEKRSKGESDKIFEALDMAENLDVKIEAILKKLETLYVIELQLEEVHAKVASIEDSVSRLGDTYHKVQNNKTREKHGGTRRRIQT